MIELYNVAFVSQYNLNLILLRQLRVNGITYHNQPDVMMLMKDGRAVTYARREQNLFVLDLAALGKVMALITGQDRPTYLVSKNKSIRI